MTIERGQSWGSVAPLPIDGVIVRTDAEASAAVARAIAAGAPLPTVGLLGGDLCRTVGGRGDEGRLRSADAVTLPIDVGEVELDGQPKVFLAHVVARRSWWHGEVWAAMNAEWIGDWDVAPRSHPGDGLLDVFDVTMSIRDRMKARPRLSTGTHLPHPAIGQKRTGVARIDFPRPMGVWIDGVKAGDARSIEVRLTGQLVDVVV